FKEYLFTSCIEHGILQDSSEPSNDNPNVANAPREPFVVNHDPGKNSSQSTPQINHHCCYACGDPLEGIFCHQCTCKLCGNDAHYGYNCPPKVPIIPNPEPFNNQTIKELPPTVQRFDPKSDLIHDSPNFRLSIRNHVTIKTLIFRKNFKIFNKKIFVVKIAGLLMELTNVNQRMQTIIMSKILAMILILLVFDQISPQQYTVNHPIFNVQNDLFDFQNKLMEQLTSMCDMVGQFIQKKEEEKQIEEEQAANALY
nr:hypothetical protein [Tanacetum cinerariifolium]